MKRLGSKYHYSKVFGGLESIMIKLNHVGVKNVMEDPKLVMKFVLQDQLEHCVKNVIFLQYFGINNIIRIGKKIVNNVMILLKLLAIL